MPPDQATPTISNDICYSDHFLSSYYSRIKYNRDGWKLSPMPDAEMRSSCILACLLELWEIAIIPLECYPTTVVCFSRNLEVSP